MENLELGTYVWERFLNRPDGLVALTDSGFLFDPDSQESFYKKTDVLSFRNVRNLNCLILLGEPGNGKSISLRHEYLNQMRSASSNQISVFKDLNEYGEENRFIKEVFQSAEIETWLRSEKHLYLYLDSFDECLLEIHRLFQIIRVQLANFSEISSRLYLRVASRTGYWSENFTSFFRHFFGENHVGVYELSPLRINDVELAARYHSINHINFIQEIINKELQPLAILPISLDLLIQEFLKSNFFISTREELFYAACKALCTDPNYERRFIYKNSISAEKRIAIASRIAAVMMFCNKRVVDLNNYRNISSDAITIDIFNEGDETTGSFNFQYTQNDIIETLTETSLFTNKGNLQFGFSHFAYAEYLAAKFIVNHNFEIEQIKSLIILSTDEEGKIIPQMKGVAAWLSIIAPTLTEYTIKNDPQNLLFADIENLGTEYKEKLVDSLFLKLRDNTIDDADWGLHKHYKKLFHANLSNQLRPFIEDKDGYFLTRRVAIDIAEECNLSELNPILLKVALDESDKIYIRSNAVYALIKTADYDSRNKLMLLATEQQSSDENDDLKGNALRALWPDILSTKEVFKVLTPPKRNNYSGGYAIFIHILQNNIKKDDLDECLKWIIKYASIEEGSNYHFDNLQEIILYLAWQNIQSIIDKSLFAKVLYLRMSKYLTVFPTPQQIRNTWNPLSIDDKTRLLVFKELIKIIQLEDIHYIRHNEIIKNTDFEELIEIFLNTENSEDKLKIAKVINSFYYTNSKQINTILTLCESHNEMKIVFDYWIRTIEIDSEESTKLRKRLAQEKEWEAEAKERKRKQEGSRIDVFSRITNSLNSFKSEKSVSSWYQLFMDLTLTEKSTHYGDEFNSDIFSLPGWEYVDDNLKNQIIESAKYYVTNFEENPSEWFGTNIFYRPATAGYKSLILLFALERSFIDSLTAEHWKKWKYILLDYPESYGFKEKSQTYLDLIIKAYQVIPHELIDITLKKIDNANKGDDIHLFFLEKVDSCLDAKFQSALLGKVKDPSMKAEVRSILLAKLLEKGNNDALSYNISLFEKSDVKDKILYGKSLASFCDSISWEIIMNSIKTHQSFGEEFFLMFTDTYFPNMIPLLNRITETQSAELFIWLTETFPREKDPKFEGAHTVGPRESIGNFRDQILQSLTGKGTRESISALNKIKENKKDLNIEFYLVQARKNYRMLNWEPLTPKDLLSLARSSTIRVVLNPSDLQNLIIESLKRLEFILQGSNSLSGVLWDKIKKDKYRPKSEEHLSDYIKHHLDIDLRINGISSFREVQLRKPNFVPGGKSGEVTDIFVSFSHPKTNEEYNVIIEIKGSWNDSVNTNMKSQLSDRYLETSKCKNGIYLVGWYNCEAYDNQINKTGQATLKDAINYYENEARITSTGEKIIKAFVLDCSLKN